MSRIRLLIATLLVTRSIMPVRARLANIGTLFRIAGFFATGTLLLFSIGSRADAAIRGLHSTGVMAATTAVSRNSSSQELITFTLQGDLAAGENGIPYGQVPGPFGGIGPLVGKHYTLWFTFDPSTTGAVLNKQHDPLCLPNIFFITQLFGSGSSSPGTAALEINGVKYSFGSAITSTSRADIVTNPCAPAEQASFSVSPNGTTSGSTIVQYSAATTKPAFNFGFPVDIWSHGSWPAPDCRYTISPGILYYYTSVAMQFQIAQNGLYANGSENGTKQKLTFTITNSLYPCKT